MARPDRDVPPPHAVPAGSPPASPERLRTRPGASARAADSDAADSDADNSFSDRRDKNRRDPDRQPLFLERESYRQRRMMDALRILPVLGLMLWMLPVFWPLASAVNDPEAAVAVSTAIIYVFGIWAFLILAAAALWLILRDRLTSDLPGRDRGS